MLTYGGNVVDIEEVAEDVVLLKLKRILQPKFLFIPRKLRYFLKKSQNVPGWNFGFEIVFTLSFE